MKMLLVVGFGLLCSYQAVLCDKVTQSSLTQILEAGSERSLHCTYETGLSNPELYWYRIRADHSLQFVLYRDDTESYNADFTEGRFSVQHNKTKKTFHLVISQAETGDSATYYCALRSHDAPGAQEVCTQTPGPCLQSHSSGQPTTLDLASLVVILSPSLAIRGALICLWNHQRPGYTGVRPGFPGSTCLPTADSVGPCTKESRGEGGHGLCLWAQVCAREPCGRQTVKVKSH